ncbi:DUF4974 domain-containing protein [Chitinophaga silvatica]|uniref:DUF4974 domain-containing protein n=1 Tax=Chitinophaga silvatica TaxID=2282649 RepID=A0A3E1Y447_9BACT|nr:FecR domain-containing protein [Chitinophaga silvatica]RFS19433.1 DUF4974 domain-containing protein [Chitinophaga silvatica]
MEPNQHQLNLLLERIYSGTANEQEKEIIRNWIISMDIHDTSVTAETLQVAKLEMLDRILTTNTVVTTPTLRSNGFRKVLRTWKAAAAVLVLAIASWFLLNKNKPSKDPVYTTIAATQRNIKHIELPDGSQVWLNAGSRLEYIQDQFNKDKRCVKLTGEGFFSITPDEARPFIVSSDHIETQVLGTTFNIETYPGETEIRIALVQGSVAVKDTHTNSYTVLHPNEMLRYSRVSGQTGVVGFSNKVGDWVNGHMIFEELPLGDVLDRIAYRFGISIQYDKALVMNKRVTGNINPDKWQTVLDDILFIHKLRYTTQNGIVYISKR